MTANLISMLIQTEATAPPTRHAYALELHIEVWSKLNSKGYATNAGWLELFGSLAHNSPLLSTNSKPYSLVLPVLSQNRG